MSHINFNVLLGNGNVNLGGNGMSYNPMFGGNPFGGCGCDGGFGNLFGGFGGFGGCNSFSNFGGGFNNFGGCFGGGFNSGFEMNMNPMGFSMGGYNSYSNPMMGGYSCFGNGFGMPMDPGLNRTLNRTMSTMFGLSEVGMGLSTLSNAFRN